ncbi:MAG: SRPBCC family protein [Chloroflexota bacterium]
MISVEKSVQVNRPIGEVFAYATDISKNAEWSADIVRAEQTSPGPVGVGATSVLVQKFLGKEMKNDVAVTVYDPPHRFGFKTTSGPVQFEGMQTFEEVEGGTRMTFSMKGEAGGFFKVAEGLLGKEVEKSFERDLKTLKAKLEG